MPEEIGYASSVIPLNDAARTMVRNADMESESAPPMASEVPARIIR